MIKKIYIVLFLLGFSCTWLNAQEETIKKIITIFNVADGQGEVSEKMLAPINRELQEILNELEPFEVESMEHALTSLEAGQLIDVLDDRKRGKTKLSQSVTIGDATFNPEDLSQLMRSSFIVIPFIDFLSVKENQSGDSLVEIGTKFSIINVDDFRPAALFTVETSGIEPTRTAAIQDALDDISTQFNYEIKRIPQLQMRSGIIDVLNRWEVVIEFGKTLGVRAGDEYAIVDTRITDSGDAITEQTGLLIVKRVEDNLSFARVLFSNGKPQIGDHIKKIPRLGTESTIYTHALLSFEEPTLQALHIGVRQSLSRGFYWIKPFLGLEFPLIFVSGGSPLPFGFPLTLHGGVELAWYLGRFLFTPAVSGGVTGTFPTGGTEPFLISHAGFKTELFVHFLLSNSFRIFLNAGYSYWFGLTDFPNYGGIVVGAGVRIKY